MTTIIYEKTLLNFSHSRISAASNRQTYFKQNREYFSSGHAIFRKKKTIVLFMNIITLYLESLTSTKFYFFWKTLSLPWIVRIILRPGSIGHKFFQDHRQLLRSHEEDGIKQGYYRPWHLKRLLMSNLNWPNFQIFSLTPTDKRRKRSFIWQMCVRHCRLLDHD